MADADANTGEPQQDVPQATIDGAAPPQDREIGGGIPTIDISKVEDPDMVDLHRARAELGEVTLTGDTATPAPPPTESATEATATPADAQQKDQPTIPKPRFDEVLADKARAERDAAYWRGVAQARGEQAGTSPQAPPRDEPPKAKTVDEVLGDLAAEEDDIAAKHDNGETTEVEKTKALRDVRNREFAARQAAMAPPPVTPPAQSITVADVKDQLAADQHAEALYQQHPYSKLLWEASATDPVTAARQEMVRTEARAEVLRDHPGISGHQADVLFRESLAKVANSYGPAWFPGAKVNQPQTNPAGADPAKSPSPQAQARLDKMGVERAQPPDIGNLGTSAGGDEWTPEKVMQLTDDQFARLPDSVRQRFL